MKDRSRNPQKGLYELLRALPCKQLWEEEVARFDRMPSRERFERAAVVRAVGVVFSESGTAEQKDEARGWLRRLLRDPCERIRRYSMAAIPKIGAGPEEETELLSLLRATSLDRERDHLERALEKIGGPSTLAQLERGAHRCRLQTEQKIKASLARSRNPSAVRMDNLLSDFTGLRIHLHGRNGLEQIMRVEVEENTRTKGQFRVVEVGRGLVAITPLAPFALADIFTLRCFSRVGFALGLVSISDPAVANEALASVITSPLSRRLLGTFTEGSIRYRLDFESKGHQRGAVHLLANRAYAICPEILNDARKASWVIAIHPTEGGNTVELCPKLPCDPRFYYRCDDVPAASHPPLAACMARLAGKVDNEIVWDPFCGSGLELIERALLGGVRSIYGTDHSAEAIAIARNNFAAANAKSVDSKFVCCDFRDSAAMGGLGPESATLIITNPPMGKRVPVYNLDRLIEDLFSVAAFVLQPGGRLVFANPSRLKSPHRLLELQSRQVVDMGGFKCRLEVYFKSSP